MRACCDQHINVPRSVHACPHAGQARTTKHMHCCTLMMQTYPTHLCAILITAWSWTVTVVRLCPATCPLGSIYVRKPRMASRGCSCAAFQLLCYMPCAWCRYTAWCTTTCTTTTLRAFPCIPGIEVPKEFSVCCKSMWSTEKQNIWLLIMHPCACSSCCPVDVVSEHLGCGVGGVEAVGHVSYATMWQDQCTQPACMRPLPPCNAEQQDT